MSEKQQIAKLICLKIKHHYCKWHKCS